MQDATLSPAEEFLGEGTFYAKGKAYEILAMPLRYILNGEFSGDKLIMPRDENYARFQMLNITTTKDREKTDKWMRRLLRFEGNPVTLALAAEHGWTITDIGRFLADTVKMSG